MTVPEIINTLNTIKKQDQFSKYRFGLAGSYAKGTAQPDSDIDIVVSTSNLSPVQIDSIKSSFNDADVDVLQLDLLREEDESLDRFAIQMGLPINNNSVYKTVSREVIWV